MGGEEHGRFGRGCLATRGRHRVLRSGGTGGELVHRHGRVRAHGAACPGGLSGRRAGLVARRGCWLPHARALAQQPRREEARAQQHIRICAGRLRAVCGLRVRLGVLAVGVAGQRGVCHDPGLYHRVLLPVLPPRQQHRLHPPGVARQLGAGRARHPRRRERLVPECPHHGREGCRARRVRPFLRRQLQGRRVHGGLLGQRA